jgi:hypothetical protein
MAPGTWRVDAPSALPHTDGRAGSLRDGSPPPRPRASGSSLAPGWRGAPGGRPDRGGAPWRSGRSPSTSTQRSIPHHSSGAGVRKTVQGCTLQCAPVRGFTSGGLDPSRTSQPHPGGTRVAACCPRSSFRRDEGRVVRPRAIRGRSRFGTQGRRGRNCGRAGPRHRAAGGPGPGRAAGRRPGGTRVSRTEGGERRAGAEVDPAGAPGSPRTRGDGERDGGSGRSLRTRASARAGSPTGPRCLTPGPTDSKN